MKLLYIDESGDTIPLTQEGKKHLVLTGCIIDESNVRDIDDQLRAIKKKYYQNSDIEIKSNFLRYANPDLQQTSPIKLMSRVKYDELEADVAQFLKQIPIELITIVIAKEEYWQKYPSQNPYEVAYMFLLERFQKYLAEQDSLGICIIDPREGRVEKHYFGDEINDLHEKMRRSGREDGYLWSQCPNVVEKLLFSQSDKTIGIQIADLYCYPVFHIYEYGKQPSEYWRFNDITLPKLQRKNGRVDGIGIKFFPGPNKKALS
jgi:hypothetical protein